MTTLLLELSDHFTADAERRRTTIALEIDARVTICGNVELMCRAIDNVLRNALHHAPDESGIDIRCNQHNGQVLLAIREWGEGYRSRRSSVWARRFSGWMSRARKARAAVWVSVSRSPEGRCIFTTEPW